MSEPRTRHPAPGLLVEDPLSAEVDAHLGACVSCRAERRRLLSTDAATVDCYTNHVAAWLGDGSPPAARRVSEALAADPSMLVPAVVQAVRGVVGSAGLSRWRAMADQVGAWASSNPDLDLSEVLDAMRADEVSTEAVLTATLALVETERWRGGRYRRQAVLGEGGMGVVTRVWDTLLARDVALKELRPDRRQHAGQFLAEAHVTAALDHPGIVAVFDIGELPDGRPFYTMEVITGATLAEAVTTPSWALPELIRVFEQVCNTVGYAHAAGFVHRDLKPSNVLIGPFGVVRVVDWGIAVRLSRAREAARAGTPGFAAPEQASGQPFDVRADVYSLGVVLDRLLTARGVRPDLLLDLVERCTSREPNERPADASAVANRVRSWLDGEERRVRADRALQEARQHARYAAEHRRTAQDLRATAAAALAEVPRYAPVSDKLAAWHGEDKAAAEEIAAEVREARYEQGLRSAIDEVPDHPEALDALAELYKSRVVQSERAGKPAEIARFETMLAGIASGRYAGWLDTPGSLSLATEPAGAAVVARRIERVDRRLVETDRRPLGVTPLREHPLPRGSWVLTISHPDAEDVRYPVFVERGEHWDGIPPECLRPFAIPLPARGTLGPEERYVPAGWFWAGGDPEASDALPRRRLWTDGFVMHARPVTHREYLAFLNDLIARGDVELAQALAPGHPDRTEGVVTRPYETLPSGHFRLRTSARPDGPVNLVDAHCADAFASWTAERTGRPWRLAQDLEWEKAARGVDGRHFPWGDFFDPSFACMAQSHAGQPAPAPVDGFAIDRSPYGVRGLAGNVRDWCANPYVRDGPPGPRVEPVVFEPGRHEYRFLRGGAYLSSEPFLRSASRVAAAPTERAAVFGIRLVRSVTPDRHPTARPPPS